MTSCAEVGKTISQSASWKEHHISHPPFWKYRLVPRSQLQSAGKVCKLFPRIFSELPIVANRCKASSRWSFPILSPFPVTRSWYAWINWKFRRKKSLFLTGHKENIDPYQSYRPYKGVPPPPGRVSRRCPGWLSDFSRHFWDAATAVALCLPSELSCQRVAAATFDDRLEDHLSSVV